MRLVLARHGRTRANAEGIIQGSTLDPPLDAVGWMQAEELASRVGPLDAVYASSMLRARQTALVVASAQQLPLAGTFAGLRELSWGELDGRPLAHVKPEFDAIVARWRAGETHASAPGAESPEMAWSRASAALQEIQRRHAPAERVLVVAHGRINAALLAGLSGDLARMEDHLQPNAAHAEVNLLEAEPASLRR